MPIERTAGMPSTRRYSPEGKRAAVRMVRSLPAETGMMHGAVGRVAEQLGYGVESVRSWVTQAEIDAGARAGTTTSEAERLKELEQETGGDFLRGGARPPTAQIVAFIEANKDAIVDGRRLGVEPIWEVLQVASSTYYAAGNRLSCERAQRDAELIPRLVELWKATDEV